VTLLNGDGGTGKSLLALQLAVSTALCSTWLGMSDAGLTAEDDRDEVHRRLDDIMRHMGAKLEDLHDLHIVSLAGEDALLAVPDRHNVLEKTHLFGNLEKAIGDINPAIVILDTLADLHAGEENARNHARQFVGMLRGLAQRYDTTILLLAHPSLSGMSNKSGTSGSTAWNNSVRSRLYLERVKDESDVEQDHDARVLRTMKANYAAIGGEIHMRWHNGVFVLTSAPGASGGLTAFAARENADRIFLELLGAYEVEKRDVSASNSVTYAPAVFARDPRSGGVGKRALVDAMNRLFAAKRIEVVESGPPSKRRKRLVVFRHGGG
jgi:RecA-family ATPase